MSVWPAHLALHRPNLPAQRSAAAEMALSHSLLRGVAAGAVPPLARIYRPRAALAFSRLDRRRPGFEPAREAAARAGFEPALRLVGGRAAAIHTGTVVFEAILAADPTGIESRYEAGAALLRDSLADAGAATDLGELPGEYCAGRFSLSLGGRLKVAGLAQRIVAGACLLSALVQVEDGPPVRRVMRAVHENLGLPFDPRTAGALDECVAGIGCTAVEEALVARLRGIAELRPWEAPAATEALADRLLPRHLLAPVPTASEGARPQVARM